MPPWWCKPEKINKARSLIFLVILLLLYSTTTVAQVDGAELFGGERFRTTMRGLGHVEVTLRVIGDKKEASWTTFSTEDAQHAKICASKRLADLMGFGDLEQVANSGLPGTVLQLKGVGWWLLGIEGAKFHELYAPSLQTLARIAKDCGAERWQPVPPKAYPRWLDCFDNSAVSIWVGGAGENYVLPSDFEWLRERKLAFCVYPLDESRLVGPGLLDTTIFDWHSAMAAKYDLPYRVQLFPSTYAWLWNRKPLPYVRPAPGRTNVASWLEYQVNTCALSPFEPIPMVEPYNWDLRRRLAAHLEDDPNYIGMHGATEIPDAGIVHLSAVSGTPGIKEMWHTYLSTVLGWDLATVGRMHRGDPNYYRSWDEVEVPHPEDFLGWNPATCLDLRGTWQMHEDTARRGEEEGWFDPAKSPADWVEGDCNDPIIQIYAPTRNEAERVDFWMRRTFRVSSEQRSTLSFLHIARSVYHENYTPLFDVWINGKKLQPISDDHDFSQCFVVGDALKEGENLIVINTHGSPIPGYCFLGPTPLRKYPRMTETENRLWFDAVNFDAWLRVKKIEGQLRATRAVDPNRPLKLMANIHLLDLTTPLCEHYGAYQHDTGGAAGYWCPMTGARLARSHGLPWSSEPGGPPRDAADLQAYMTFYLMYGNDAVDLVFNVGHYRDKPDVATWFDHNRELINCIGKIWMPTPPIAILRSTRATRLGFREPWNWDIARGPLQGVGRNFVYIEVPDILNGLIDRFPVVIDAGTVVLTEEEIEGIRRYVRLGGIFVAQHHTGQHTPSKSDVWALARAFGLTVTPKFVTGENYHEWPLGKIRFARDQDLFPSLRGKEVEGSGVAILGQASNIRPIATWEDGTMAIAEVVEGRGRFILLGTPIFMRMRDVKGIWVNEEEREVLLDEFLTSLGVERESWTGSREVWGEHWLSKNGIYDLYLVSRMTKVGDEVKSVSVTFRREAPVSELVEMSTPGHPRIKVEWKDGRMTLPVVEYGRMQARVYAAPRADIVRSALDWIRYQAQIWRALPPIEEKNKIPLISTPEDMIPLMDGWVMKVEGKPEKVVRLGTFASLGLPEDARVIFERTITLPETWRGKRINLVFDAQFWFWGILPQGRLWVNGKEVTSKQPITPMPNQSFSLDVTEEAAGGSLVIRLEIDGTNKSTMRSDQKGLFKPHGVTGLFYLQAMPLAVKTEPLSAWQAVSAFNRSRAVKPGENVDCLYLETRFSLPKEWPAKRLFLESPQPLGFIALNDYLLLTPGWMKQLDITGLVHRDGRENVLRWVPAAISVPSWNRSYTGVVPEMNLVWRE